MEIPKAMFSDTATSVEDALPVNAEPPPQFQETPSLAETAERALLRAEQTEIRNLVLEAEIAAAVEALARAQESELRAKKDTADARAEADAGRRADQPAEPENFGGPSARGHDGARHGGSSDSSSWNVAPTKTHRGWWATSVWSDAPVRTPAQVVDERFSGYKATQWCRCDGRCGKWKCGINTGKFLSDVKHIRAEDREEAWKAGDFDATWLCIECRRQQGETDAELERRLGFTDRRKNKREYLEFKKRTRR